MYAFFHTLFFSLRYIIRHIKAILYLLSTASWNSITGHSLFSCSPFDRHCGFVQHFADASNAVTYILIQMWLLLWIH